MKLVIQKVNRKIILLYCGLVVLAILFLLLLYRDAINHATEIPRSIFTVRDEPFTGTVSNQIPMVEGKHIEQKISMISTEWSGFSLYFCEKQVETEGCLEIKLSNSFGEIVGEWEFSSEDLGAEGFYYFTFESMKTERNEEFYISIETLFSGENPITLMGSKEIPRCIVNGNEEDFSLSYELLNGNNNALRYLWMLLATGIMGCLSISFFLTIARIKKEWLVAIFAFVTGIIYILVIPPYSVPDEGIHYLTAYAESSRLLGKEALDKDGNVVMESEMMNFYTREECPSRSTYSKYIRGIFGENELVEMKNQSAQKPLTMKHLGYVPQVFGVSLGRILNLNPIQLFYLGRLFGLIWYCFVLFWAIHLAPDFAKNILFVVGMLPMTMQLAISYNYDSILIGTSLFLVAYILFLACEESKTNVNIKDISILLLTIMVIVPIKFVYFPLVGLGLLIPDEKFGGRKKKIIVAVALCIFALLMMFFTRMDVVVNSISSVGEMEADAQCYTIMDIMREPVKILAMFVRTININMPFYLESMIGERLGWLEIDLPDVVSMLAVILLFMGGLQRSVEKHAWNIAERIWCFILVGLSGVMIFLALLIDHIPNTSPLIEGVQGRYFIPILPVFMIMLQNHVVVIKRNIDHILVVTMNLLHLLVVYNVVYIVVNRW